MVMLIKKALVLDERSKHHGKRRDVLVENGRIAAIGADLAQKKATIISDRGLIITPGWIDMRANFRDPGFEFKEDIASGIQAALRGGFKHVVLMPSVSPVTDNKSAIEYVLGKFRNTPVIPHPVGTISRNMEGTMLAEMFDMHSTGAIAFGDDKKPVSTELMVRALEYVQTFDGLLFSFPFDPGVNPGGMIHEGKMSASLGMKGLSSLSEELKLSRDIDLLRYCGGRLHVSTISTSRSVDLVRKAKKEGLRISCALAAHQLYFTEDDLATFDSNLKTLPPFRTLSDRKALIAGLKDGTIDAICSDHCPEDVEHKEVEFDQAAWGISSIESAFCTAFTALSDQMEIGEIVAKFTTGPAAILGLQLPTIDVGLKNDFTVFAASGTTSFTPESWQSRSRNSPLMHRELKGKVIA